MRETTMQDLERHRWMAGAVIARGGYRQRLTVAELAWRMQISARTLQRAYAETSDTTFSEELREVRLRAGAELLAGQAIAVADVGRLVGFRSPSAFAAAFARRYGLTPAAFRRAARDARARTPVPLIPPPRAATGRGS